MVHVAPENVILLRNLINPKFELLIKKLELKATRYDVKVMIKDTKINNKITFAFFI
jgi:hypothetical protein